MMALFYIGGLAISAAFVSILAATFSVSGLAKLFSGSAVAVLLMGASLEIAKFVTAAFLHRVWSKLHWMYKAYMFTAVVVLSLITSMGIFGFLSDAYQSSSTDLTEYTIKLESLKADRQRYTDEVARLNKQVDEIPLNRVTKRAELRKETEPQIKELLAKDEVAAGQVRDMDLKIVEVKNKVGPLIYIARAFNKDLDTVVKWLILVFVSVFDPLAICLVIATGEAIRMKPLGYLDGMTLLDLTTTSANTPRQAPPPAQVQQPTLVPAPGPNLFEVPLPQPDAVVAAPATPTPPATSAASVETLPVEPVAPEIEVVEMRVPEKPEKAS
jgi:hypothetical protein